MAWLLIIAGIALTCWLGSRPHHSEAEKNAPTFTMEDLSTK